MRERDAHHGTKVQIWTTQHERDRWTSAAGTEGMTLSGWMRRAANRAADAEGKMQKVREVLT